MADETPVQPATLPVPTSDTGHVPGSEATPATPINGEKLFTQADLERQIDDRLKRERAKAETQAQKALAEAEERRNTEQGEFAKLAEQRKKRLDELEPKAELADRLSELVSKQLDAELATWPEEARPLVLPPESPLLQRLESADRARPIAQKLLAAQAQAPSGLRYPQQHPGNGSTAPTTTKEIALSTLNKAYAPRRPAT